MREVDGGSARAAKAIYIYFAVSALVFAVVLVVNFFFLAPEKPASGGDKPLSVLIVGNDVLHFNDVPSMLQEVAEMSSANPELEVSCFAREDYSLAQHVADGSATAMIKEGDFDFVVLQERWLAPLQDPAAMLEAAKTLSRLARDRGSRVVLLIPWADAKEEKRQSVVSSVMRKLAERLSIDVAPAGDVFFEAARQHEDLNAYAEDKHHVSALGSWLAAATIYTAVTGRKALLIPARFTYHGENGDEPHVPVSQSAAGNLESIVFTVVNEENKGRKPGAYAK